MPAPVFYDLVGSLTFVNPSSGVRILTLTTQTNKPILELCSQVKWINSPAPIFSHKLFPGLALSSSQYETRSSLSFENAHPVIPTFSSPNKCFGRKQSAGLPKAAEASYLQLWISYDLVNSSDAATTKKLGFLGSMAIAFRLTTCMKLLPRTRWHVKGSAGLSVFKSN